MKKENEILSKANAFDLTDIIERYMYDQDLPINIANAHFIELKRYLIMCAVHPEKKYKMTKPIDDAWHVFLLFTEQYAKFCQILAGRFIHHRPEKRQEKITDEELEKKQENYKMFKKDYIELFFDEPPIEYWPSMKKIDGLDTCHAGNCSRCHGNECD